MKNSILTCFFGFFIHLVFANGVKIEQLSATADNKFSFQLSWHNSWRNLNHDAIWLFAKGQTDQGIFEHLDIELLTSELAVSIPADSKGAFVFPKQNGSFDSLSSVMEVSFKLFSLEKYHQIRLFAIEMVFVPQGSFILGDTACNFTLLDPKTRLPLKLESEQPLELAVKGEDFRTTLMPSFPKGYEGFFMMKYEISQQQYAQFLNTLSPPQQMDRTANTGPGFVMMAKGFPQFRNSIEKKIDGSYHAQSPHRACNFLSWDDLLAYLDWAALRPMSELEYEKASRGSDPVVEKGFPWSTNLFVNANTVLFDGTADETVAEMAISQAGLTNCGGEFGTVFLQGPLRCGFGNGDDRFSAGASQWGIRELAGNLWEMCVSVKSNFDGSHGDGNLSTPTNWPTNGGYRGGAWNSLIKNELSYPFRDLAISDRFYMNLANTERRNTTGGRGVRNIK